MDLKRHFNFTYDLQALTGSGDACHLGFHYLNLGLPLPHVLEVIQRN